MLTTCIAPPGNTKNLEKPYNVCDPFSNPQPQETVQILPHTVWGEYGYPTKKGEGWIGHPRTWELDVGRLSQALYFYQDPGTEPIERYWQTIDLGTEIYISKDKVAEWTVKQLLTLSLNRVLRKLKEAQ
ncbi:Serine/threonine protein kinase [Quillaja saponaria]|uniref:Serine/threonine protein kinase n=1 Tax=Quillaja saponaria TaxID=32244 RepID=A0AAD7QI34_QUISA|nr:Serine/threonine protein kinase [Quillaja saponaria]